jgi:hypothetical protein
MIAGSMMLAIMAMIMLFNAVIDPFGMYRLADWPGVNLRKPAISQHLRLAKAYEVQRMAPRAIVLGTSRSHVGLRMTHPAWSVAPRYNLAFDGATTREMYAYLIHAQSLRPLTQVILGLDSWHLSESPSGTRPGFDPDILHDSSYLLSHARAAGADGRILVSIHTLAASLQTIRDQENTEPEWLTPDGQRLGDAFFHRAGELFHEDSPRAYFDAYDREEIRWRRPRTSLPASPAAPADPAGSSLNWIYRMIGFCRANNIDLRIYITPGHAHQLEMTAASGDWRRLEKAKRELVAYLAADAQRYPHQPAIPLWDFSGYSSITTESLPPHGGNAEMRYYWDSSHFKENVGDWVLDRMLSGPSHQRRPPADFGVQLFSTNIDRVLDGIGAARAEYVRTHAEEVDEIATLFRAEESKL